MSSKLVRDNIPDIIKSNGGKCKIEILNDDEYKEALNQKLIEEVNEYMQSKEIEELADIIEVIYAILKNKKVSLAQFEIIRNEKLMRNGGFNKKYLLNIEN